MKTTKRIMSLMLVLVMMLSMMALPVSAANDPNFANFPGVWGSTQYSVATVAVQKFLMLYGDSLAKKLMPSGGADGICGGKTVECIQTFHTREGLYDEDDDAYGTIDQASWIRIGQKLEDTEITPSSSGTRYWYDNRSYYASLDSNEDVIFFSGVAYYAVNHLGTQSSYPFYP